MPTKSKNSKPPFNKVVFGHYHVDPCWSAEKLCWYITVVNTQTGNHLHFDYTPQLHKNAILIARYAHKGCTPKHYQKDSRQAIVYLIAGGKKPRTRTRRKNDDD